MGTDYSKLPPSIEAMQPSAKTVSVDVEYCSAWGGLKEANFTEKIIKHVFPKAFIVFCVNKPNKLKRKIQKTIDSVFFSKSRIWSIKLIKIGSNFKR